jgi:hypothetical protein
MGLSATVDAADPAAPGAFAAEQRQLPERELRGRPSVPVPGAVDPVGDPAGKRSVGFGVHHQSSGDSAVVVRTPHARSAPRPVMAHGRVSAARTRREWR